MVSPRRGDQRGGRQVQPGHRGRSDDRSTCCRDRCVRAGCNTSCPLPAGALVAQDGPMRTGAARGDHGRRPDGRRRRPGRFLHSLSVLLVWAAAAQRLCPAAGWCMDYAVPGGRSGRTADAARRARRRRCCCWPSWCRGTPTPCRSWCRGCWPRSPVPGTGGSRPTSVCRLTRCGPGCVASPPAPAGCTARRCAWHTILTRSYRPSSRSAGRSELPSRPRRRPTRHRSRAERSPPAAERPAAGRSPGCGAATTPPDRSPTLGDPDRHQAEAGRHGGDRQPHPGRGPHLIIVADGRPAGE